MMYNIKTLNEYLLYNTFVKVKLKNKFIDHEIYLITQLDGLVRINNNEYLCVLNNKMYTENGEVVYIELSEYIILECIPILYKKDKLFKKTKINNGLEIYPIVEFASYYIGGIWEIIDDYKIINKHSSETITLCNDDIYLVTSFKVDNLDTKDLYEKYHIINNNVSKNDYICVDDLKFDPYIIENSC